MKTIMPLGVTTVKATAALTATLAVSMAGALATSGMPLGVCLADTDNGEYAPVATSGIVLVTAGGAISVAGPVKPTTGGKFVAQGGSGDIVGYALDEATQDGDKIRVKLL